MITANLYLNFNGTTENAFKFYQSIFGGEFSRLQRFREVPGMEGLSAEDGEKIIHISLPVGKNLVLHATDAMESMGRSLTAGNNFSILLEPESKEEAESYFNRLSAGGKVDMPLQDVFWGGYYGLVTDQYGIQWMVNYEKSQDG